MPRQTIRKLAVDVERVMVAGAHLAAADPELARNKAALDALASQLGGRAPVIGQLAEQLGKAVTSSGAEAVRALMNLATTAAQVRAAQAEPATPPAEAAPIAPMPSVGTPCNARELYDLHTALVESGQGRLETVQQAIDRGDIADLRLVEDLIQAMGDPYIGQVVADKAVPLVGRAIVAPIRARLNLKGRATDGRRLRALVAVEKQGALDLIEAAIREGSAEVRAAALEAIGEHVRGLPRLEPLIQDVMEKDRSGDVRRAAMSALAGYGSETALAALLDGLGDSATRNTAAGALAASGHPQVVDRLLACLGQALAPPAKGKDAGKSAKPAKGAAGGTKAAKDERREHVCAALRALAGHSSPAAARAAMELVDEFGAAAAWAVVKSGDRGQLEKIAGLLKGDDDDLWSAAVAAAWKLGENEAYKRLAALFASKKSSPERLQIMGRSIHDGVGEKWVDFLIDVATGKDGPAATAAAAVLGRLKARRAVQPLVKRIQKGKGPNSDLIRALGQIGDSAAVDVILEHGLGSSDHTLGWAACTAILALADRSTVDKVRTRVARAKETNWYTTNLLARLESMFPGA